MVLWLAVRLEVGATTFATNNSKVSHDRLGLTRSVILRFDFIGIHAVGNLRVFKGPEDFNGYGYFYVRLYWNGFGFRANTVEEYNLLSVLLHVVVGLKHTLDIKLAQMRAMASRAADVKFPRMLKEECSMNAKGWEERQTTRPAELQAVPHLQPVHLGCHGLFEGLLRLQLVQRGGQELSAAPSACAAWWP